MVHEYISVVYSTKEMNKPKKYIINRPTNQGFGSHLDDRQPREKLLCVCMRI